MRLRSVMAIIVGSLCLWPMAVRAEPLKLHLRSRQETAPQSGNYHAVTRDEQWQPQETAIISAYFAAPPADVTKVNVELPAKAGSFIDVPIS